ncbi:MAG: DUF3473 domain-containing protein, partial [Phycisphaerales bacterium]|nr:DUF3473 domain-containing protein [Phycisphaerales bacterium]
IPWGGGAWFRLFPYPLFAWGAERILRSGKPLVFYIHPWEIDAGQPRIGGLRWSHARRHYTNLAACGPRWLRLLKSRPWCTIRDLRAGATRVG